MERLVGFGIDLDIKDSDGDTALHVALSRRSVDALSTETPQLKKVSYMYMYSAFSLHVHVQCIFVKFAIIFTMRCSKVSPCENCSTRKFTIFHLFLHQFVQVLESFGRPGDSGPHAKATVACFLIQEGANSLVVNKKGHAPLQVCSPEVVSLVMTFKDSLATKK